MLGYVPLHWVILVAQLAIMNSNTYEHWLVSNHWGVSSVWNFIKFLVALFSASQGWAQLNSWGSSWIPIILAKKGIYNVWMRFFCYETQHNTGAHIHEHTLTPMNVRTHTLPPISTSEILIRRLRSWDWRSHHMRLAINGNVAPHWRIFRLIWETPCQTRGLNSGGLGYNHPANHPTRGWFSWYLIVDPSSFVLGFWTWSFYTSTRLELRRQYYFSSEFLAEIKISPFIRTTPWFISVLGSRLLYCLA